MKLKATPTEVAPRWMIDREPDGTNGTGYVETHSRPPAQPRDVMSWEELGETQLTLGGLVVLAAMFVVLFRPLRDKAIALMVITGFIAGFYALWMYRVTDLQAIGIVAATVITMFAAGLLLPTWVAVILFGAFGGALGFVAPVLWEDLIGWHYYLGCAIGIVLYAGSFYAFNRAGAIIDPRTRL